MLSTLSELPESFVFRALSDRSTVKGYEVKLKLWRSGVGGLWCCLPTRCYCDGLKRCVSLHSEGSEPPVTKTPIPEDTSQWKSQILGSVRWFCWIYNTNRAIKHISDLRPDLCLAVRLCGCSGVRRKRDIRTAMKYCSLLSHWRVNPISVL